MSSAATWMDLEITILSEVNQMEENKYHMILFICRIFLKRHKWTYLQIRSRITDIESKLMVTKWEGGGESDKLGGWD